MRFDVAAKMDARHSRPAFEVQSGGVASPQDEAGPSMAAFTT
jgi:hypothetical protein